MSFIVTSLCTTYIPISMLPYTCVHAFVHSCLHACGCCSNHVGAAQHGGCRAWHCKMRMQNLKLYEDWDALIARCVRIFTSRLHGAMATPPNLFGFQLGLCTSRGVQLSCGFIWPFLNGDVIDHPALEVLAGILVCKVGSMQRSGEEKKKEEGE